MASLRYVQKLFSLETLDTRFTISSKAPTSNEQLLSEPSRTVPNDTGYNLRSRRNGSTNKDAELSASKWRSPEFIAYAAVFLVAVPLMFKSVYDVSNRTYAFLIGTIEAMVILNARLTAVNSISS